MTREFLDRSADRKALIHRSDRQNTSLVMFVHGWQGGYLSTWAPVSDLLRKAADSPSNRGAFSLWDYLFLGYETRSVETYLDIASRIFSEWQDATIGGGLFPHKYSQFVLVGHSLGTLGIRQALAAQTLQPGGFLKSLHGVLLFGSPINGSPLARFGFWQRVSTALAPGNPQLRMLHAWSELAYDYSDWPNPILVLGQADKIVGSQYKDLVNWKGDDPVERMVTAGHSAMVKPASWDDAFFDHLYGVLT